ncbi:hypothetical protein R6258_14470 [Halomonas sp. HP20-15]|uniref:DUF1127 domain-containing protein n=1 Tax=Halomonas sp. HP20-15 TaxID=3085901 RepID=UPI0029815BB9|nr:hypothetical protein [Halomonas sp. HP20-15]MDW5378124.1 hypothetical protein [Halomonas sp. HP20-15]
MTLVTLFQALNRALSVRRRRRVAFDSLMHLDARLLRDIGLHVDGGAVRPLNPESFGAGDDAFRQAPLTGMPPVAAKHGEDGYCPHCGSVLT